MEHLLRIQQDIILPPDVSFEAVARLICERAASLTRADGATIASNALPTVFVVALPVAGQMSSRVRAPA